MSRTMNNLKESFTIIKEITTRKTTLKVSIHYHTIRICKVCCLKSHIINLILTSTASSLRENIRLPVFYVYGPRNNVCQDLGLIFSRNDRTRLLRSYKCSHACMYTNYYLSSSSALRRFSSSYKKV